MVSTASRRPRPGPEDLERMNEEFHILLRDAAEKREARAHAQLVEDEAAARQESADLLALAREQARAGRPSR